MTPFQLEARTLQIVERVLANHPVEDATVELKSEWPKDRYEAARQLAGHANAARGEPVLWIIGIHDRSGTVFGADAQEMSNWYSQVKSHHDTGMAPDMVMHLNVPYGQKTLVAMLFDTQRYPYVVKNPEFGKQKGSLISYELPWREATSVRSARREDLLRMMMPLELLPECEVLSADFGEWSSKLSEHPVRLTMEMYLTPRSDRRVVIPHHKCKVAIRFEDELFPLAIEELRSEEASARQASNFLADMGQGLPSAVSNSPLMVVSGAKELILLGPGSVILFAFSKEPLKDVKAERIRVVVKMQPIGASMPLVLDQVLHRSPRPTSEIAWKFRVTSV